MVLVGRSMGFFQRAAVVADMLGTEGKEDAGAVVGERAGIVGLADDRHARNRPGCG